MTWLISKSEINIIANSTALATCTCHVNHKIDKRKKQQQKPSKVVITQLEFDVNIFFRIHPKIRGTF